MTNRRTFLHASSLVTLSMLGRVGRKVPAVGLCLTGGTSNPFPLGRFPRADDPDYHGLAMRALNAATSAGASYADVRFTVTRLRYFPSHGEYADSERIAVGVRALTKGAWGFAATTESTPDEMAGLGRSASDQARGNAWSNVPPVMLGEPRPAMTGHWQTPITRDPFTVPPTEIIDLMQSANAKAIQLGAEFFRSKLVFQCQDRIFASTDGAYVTQCVYTSMGGLPHESAGNSFMYYGVENPSGWDDEKSRVTSVTPTGAGYEAVEALQILERLPEWIETLKRFARAKDGVTIPAGEYDVVFDACGLAALVSATFGPALEYDRAVGNEANAGGTSALGPPTTMLGVPYASPLVTLTADRTMPSGAATVRWDDDGVTPQPAPLIKDGVVLDYATTREFAAELAPWHHQRGLNLQSNGCAASESAMSVPVVHTPNLVLHPGPDGRNLDALVRGIDRGYLLLGGDAGTDFQQLTGQTDFYQGFTIEHGKLKHPIKNPPGVGLQVFFKTHDLWNNLVALGGAETAAPRGFVSEKGQPNQVAEYTVHVPAGHFQRVRIQPVAAH